MKKFLAALPIAAMVAWLLPVSPATAQAPTFTCRASVLRIEKLPDPLNIIPDDRIEPIVANRRPAQEAGQDITANPPQNPCVAQVQGIRNAELPVLGRPLENPALDPVLNRPPFNGRELVLLDPAVQGIGPLGLRVLFAETQEPGIAEAGVLKFRFGLPQPVGRVTLDVLTARAEAQCPTGGPPVLTGDSEFVRLAIERGPGPADDIVVDVEQELVDVLGLDPGEQVNIGGIIIRRETADHVDIVLPQGLGTIHLNHQERRGGPGNRQIVQRAFFFEGGRVPVTNTQIPNVIIAEAIADVHGCPENGQTTTAPPTTRPPTTTAPPTSPAPSPTGPRIPQCSDEKDNDGDGLIDFMRDPGCSSPQDDDETDVGGARPPQCQDGQDNDGDGRIDYPWDPGCTSRVDDDERDDRPPTDARECSDGRDNDNDGTIDGGDAGCKSPADDDEANGWVTGGGGYREDDRNLEPPGATDDFVKGGTRVNAGSFSEPCDIGDKPAGPPLVSSWHGNPDEDENPERADAQWKSFTTTRAYCRNDPFVDPENPRAEFDTGVFEGVGELKVKGAGTMTAYALWMVQDRGEPGAPPVTGIDLYEIYVCLGETRGGCTNSHLDLDVIYSGSQTLDHGNVQAHSPQAGGGPPPGGGPGPGPAPTTSPTATATATATPTPTATRSKGGGKKPRSAYVPASLDPIAAHALWARR